VTVNPGDAGLAIKPPLPLQIFKEALLWKRSRPSEPATVIFGRTHGVDSTFGSKL
jgi:hypothetical protein